VFADETLGIRTLYQNKTVLAIRDESLKVLAGSRKVADLLVGQLRKNNFLLGGHGHAGTTQLPTSIRVDNRTILKPRFWIIDLAVC
jgi:hypothetical protein